MRAILLLGSCILAIGAVQVVWAQGSVENGAKAYVELKCAKCHGEDGKGGGKTAQKMKLEMHDWTDKDVMSDMKDKYLEDIIVQGGKAIGKSKRMPRYGHKASAEKIKDMVAYTRSLAP
ncbi:MAG: cytochrome c [Candidatus Tectomicrobia bacterium]|nr:cytochrome c [Candidatus Tectomicrobia bacterium]